MRIVTYSEMEKELVGRGLPAVQQVLEGQDTEAKERLLFCLDYYMDPYYGNQLPYQAELEILLQQVVISDNPLSVKEDALGLLTSYACPPFPVLEANIHLVEEELRADVQYALDMGKEENLIRVLLSKCREILEALSEESGKLDCGVYGTMPQTAVVKYSEGENLPAVHTWRMDREGQTLARNEVESVKTPVSGMYYPEADFRIYGGPGFKNGFLSYQMGPRFGRGFMYEAVVTAEGRTELVNEQTLWVS